MKLSLTLEDKTSEFPIQAFLYHQLHARGDEVRAEVRCKLDGKPLRFDLMVLKNGIPVYVVEVKQKRRLRWQPEWERGPQGRRYALVPLPVFMVCGMEQTSMFLNIDPLAFACSEDVLWHQHWHA